MKLAQIEQMPRHLRLKRWTLLLCRVTPVVRYCRNWTHMKSYNQIVRRIVANCTLF